MTHQPAQLLPPHPPQLLLLGDLLVGFKPAVQSQEAQNVKNKLISPALVMHNIKYESSRAVSERIRVLLLYNPKAMYQEKGIWFGSCPQMIATVTSQTWHSLYGALKSLYLVITNSGMHQLIHWLGKVIKTCLWRGTSQ